MSIPPDFSSDTLTDLQTAQRQRDDAVALLQRISDLPCAPVGRDNCPACMARSALESIAAAAPVDGAE